MLTPLKTFKLEVEKSESDVFLFTWPLGSGKTTIIKNIIERMSEQEFENLVLIINDIWWQNIDLDRLRKTSENLDLENKWMKIEWIWWKGCICCWDEDSFKNTLKKLRQEEKQSWAKKTLIIEPSGIAEPEKMKAILMENWYNPKIIAMVNSFWSRNKLLDWKENELRNDVNKQLRIADIILMKSIWNADEQAMKKVIQQVYEWKKIIKVPKWEKSTENLPGNNDENDILWSIWNEIKKIEWKNNLWFLSLWKNISEKDKEITISSNNSNLTKYQLATIVNLLWENLLRAKWSLMDGTQFDFTTGNILEISDESNENKNFNFIVKNSTDKNLLKIIETLISWDFVTNEEAYQNYFWNNWIPEIPKQEEYEEKINTLVSQYNEYMAMYNQKNDLELELSNKDLDEESKNNLYLKIEDLSRKLDKLGDDMKFDNPIIWIMYKFEAYKNETWKIETVKDLIKHCFKRPDYICWKRIDFLAKYLKEKFNLDIFDENSIDQNENILNFLKENNYIQILSQDEDFMKNWLKFEYFTKWDIVAKWENYKKTPSFTDVYKKINKI